jgi:quercetin dioxygenase-like cupin family protein
MPQTGLEKEPNLRISVLGEIIDFKVTGAETAGALSVIELTSFPHNGPPPHIHHREDESFFVIEGRFSFLLGNRTAEGNPGSFFRVPKGTVHTYQNISTGPGKALVILTPAGFEKLFAEMADPEVNPKGPSGPPNPETIARLMSLAPKYGLEIKAP